MSSENINFYTAQKMPETKEWKKRCEDIFLICARQKIKEIRKQKKINQKTIAESIGLTQSQYSKIERGECPITMKQIYKIVETLNVDFRKFIEETEIIYKPFEINENIKYLAKIMKIEENELWAEMQ